MSLGMIRKDMLRALQRLFVKTRSWRNIFQTDSYWHDLILFNEYFHGDNGAGLGASHQTGWTGLVAKLIQQSGGNTR